MICESDVKGSGLLLNKSELLNGASAKKIGFVKKVSIGKQVDTEPFLRLILQDCNGLVVVGRLFHLGDFSQVAKKWNAFVNHLAIFDYDVDFWNGIPNLNIKSMQGIQEDEQLRLLHDYFKCEIDNRDNRAEKVFAEAKECVTASQSKSYVAVMDFLAHSDLLKYFVNYHEEDLCGDKSGALVLVLSSLIKQLNVSQELYGKLNEKDISLAIVSFVLVYSIIAKHYPMYITEENWKGETFTDLEKVTGKLHSLVNNEDTQRLILESNTLLGEIFGISEQHSLLSTLIINNVQMCKENSELANYMQGLDAGGSVFYKGNLYRR